MLRAAARVASTDTISLPRLPNVPNSVSRHAKHAAALKLASVTAAFQDTTFRTTNAKPTQLARLAAVPTVLQELMEVSAHAMLAQPLALLVLPLQSARPAQMGITKVEAAVCLALPNARLAQAGQSAMSALMVTSLSPQQKAKRADSTAKHVLATATHASNRTLNATHVFPLTEF
jgi:hypothetical protein